ncbi:MAG: autotransporter domain-containing protein [Mesorhizobium sp.]|nr:autotransporter domain-containing protein [Mesorhizobium sp.]TIP05706.1 MAG: autotransporter domain-containing protein [Mesorhizobium sp.]
MNAALPARSDNYTLGAYGGTQPGALGFRLGSAYTWSDVTTSRRVGFSGFADSLSGKYDAGTFQAFGDVGIPDRCQHGVVRALCRSRLRQRKGKLVHWARRTIVRDRPEQRQRGHLLDARFARLNEFQCRRIHAHHFGIPWLAPCLRRYDAHHDLNFAGANPFGIGGAPIAKEFALIELGLSTSLASNIALGVSYTGQFGDGTEGQGVSGNLNVKF